MSFDLFPSIIRMISALAIVAGLLLLGAFVFRRFVSSFTPFGSKGRLIRMIATFPIGQRKFIALLDVAGEIFAIGVAGQQISMLCKIESQDALERIQSVQAGKESVPSFREHLEGMVSRYIRPARGER
jgi:flagellar biogenesis protein FliO